MDQPIQIQKRSKTAQLPTRGSIHAAGWDLYASEECRIHPSGKSIIKTDISIAIPHGYYGRVAPRSGMSWKNHTSIGAGVIDSDYRGSIGVVMFNHSVEPLYINVGDRVAQLLIEKINVAPLVEVDELDCMERGSNGFGSTGV